MERNQKFIVVFSVILLFIAVKVISVEKSLDRVSVDTIQIRNEQQQLAQNIYQTISQALEDENRKILNYTWQMQDSDIQTLHGTVKFSVVLKEKTKEEQIYLLVADKENQQKTLLRQETGLTFCGEMEVDLTKDYDISVFSEGTVSWQQPLESMNFGQSLTDRFYFLNHFGLQAKELDRKNQKVTYQEMFGFINNYTDSSGHIVSGNIVVFNGEDEVYQADNIWVVPAKEREIIQLNIGDKPALEAYLTEQKDLDQGERIESLFPFESEQYGKEITIMNPTQIKVKITLQDQAGFLYQMILQDMQNFETDEPASVPEPSIGIGDFVLLQPSQFLEN